MRLYTRTGANALDDPEFGHFDADADGGFDLPDELSDRLHKFALHGKPMWETDVERQNRLVAEEMERAKNPATLLAAVQQLVKAAQSVTPAATPLAVPPAEVPDPVPVPAEAVRPARGRKAATASRQDSAPTI